MKRRFLAAALGICVMMGCVPAYAAEEPVKNQAENHYVVTLNEEDGFYVVENPNGGATLS